MWAWEVFRTLRRHGADLSRHVADAAQRAALDQEEDAAVCRAMQDGWVPGSMQESSDF